jgi:HAD superfamily hydrolase (TIGR01549 family)
VVPSVPIVRARKPSLPPLVLFDLDDTLFDHTLTLRASLAALRRDHPFLRAQPLESMSEQYAQLLWDTHGEVALGRRSHAEARADRFARLAAWAGRAVEPEFATQLSTEYRSHYQRLRRPVSGAPEFVTSLAGRTRVGVVTNNTLTEQREKLAFLGLDRIVDHLVTSDEVGVQKPDVGLFRAALDRARVRPEEAVMVGDSWEMDVTGAHASGIRAVWFNRFREPAPGTPAVLEFSSFRANRKLERMLAGSPGPP